MLTREEGKDTLVRITTITLRDAPFIADHTLEDRSGKRLSTVPASLYLTLIAGAARGLLEGSLRLEDVFFHRAVALEHDDALHLQTTVVREAPRGGERTGALRCEVRGRFDERAPWLTLATAAARSVAAEQHAALEDVDVGDGASRAAVEHHAAMRRRGYLYRQSIARLARGEGGARAAIDRSDVDPAAWELDPILFGACSDVALALLPPDEALYLTLGMRAVHLDAPLTRQLRCRAIPVPAQDGLVVVDLAIAGADGASLARVEGYQLKRVDRATLAASTLTRKSERLLDFFHRIEWIRRAATAGTAAAPGAWVVLADDSPSPLAASLIAALRARGPVTVVHRSEDVGSPSTPFGVVYARGLSDRSISDVPEATAAGLLALLRAVQQVGACGQPPQRFVLLTRGAFAIEASSASPDAVARSLSGFGSVVAREYPDWAFRLVDLDPEPSTTALELLEAELAECDDEQQVAHRGGHRYVPRLRAFAPPGVMGQRPMDGPGAFLVTGGLGGIGLAIAERLVARSARAIYLLSRRTPDDAVRSRLAAWNRGGERVRVLAADVADRHSLTLSLDAIRREGPLRGVFHAAGVAEDALIPRQDPASALRVLAAKVRGSLLLDELTRGDALDVFVLFSSVVATIGREGLAVYAAANAFMDALAERRRAAALPALSVAWGPWTTGMLEANPTARRSWEQSGFLVLSPASALDALETALAAGWGQDTVPSHAAEPTPRRRGGPTLGIHPAEWDLVANRIGRPPVLTELAGERKPAELDAAVLELRARLAAAPSDAARRKLVEDRVLGHVADLVDRRKEEIPLRRPFAELGTTSVAITSLAAQLQRELGIVLSPSEIFNHATVHTLSEHIVERKLASSTHQGGHDKKMLPVQKSRERDAPVQELASDLSDDEVASLLARELDTLDLGD